MSAATAARERLARLAVDLDPVAAHAKRVRTMAVYEAGQIVRDGLAHLVAHRHVDGYASDAEYFAEVLCAECGDNRDDASTCEVCSVTGCRCEVAIRSYDCGDWGDGLALCEEHTPSHRGCPHCDPADPRDC